MRFCILYAQRQKKFSRLWVNEMILKFFFISVFFLSTNKTTTLKYSRQCMKQKWMSLYRSTHGMANNWLTDWHSVNCINFHSRHSFVFSFFNCVLKLIVLLLPGRHYKTVCQTFLWKNRRWRLFWLLSDKLSSSLVYFAILHSLLPVSPSFLILF